MARPLRLGALSLGRFRPSVHLYPPLLLLTCLVASTAAPAVGSHPHESLGALEELRELLTPGFGVSPDYQVGAAGIGLVNPATGLVVPPFHYSVAPYEVSVDGFVVPSGFFLARSGAATGDSLFRLSSPSPSAGRAPPPHPRRSSPGRRALCSTTSSTGPPVASSLSGSFPPALQSRTNPPLIPPSLPLKPSPPARIPARGRLGKCSKPPC